VAYLLWVKASLGIALVAGKNLVPNPDTGNTAFRTFVFILINPLFEE